MGLYPEATTPDIGTTALTLYVYADAPGVGEVTQNDYSQLHVLEVSSLPDFVVIGTPLITSSSTLMIHRSSYSTSWKGPIQSTHVVVNGLLNGWIVSRTYPLSVYYGPDNAVRTAFWVSALGAVTAIGLCFGSWMWRQTRRLLTLRSRK